MKTKELRVYDNRVLFKCPNCGSRRNYSILNIRRKNIKCQECGRLTRCLINRRPDHRESQSGMLALNTRDGREILVMMRDISSRGIGFEVRRGKEVRLLKLGQEVSLSCNWSPSMIPRARFTVQNIRGVRIGVKVVR